MDWISTYETGSSILTQQADVVHTLDTMPERGSLV